MRISDTHIQETLSDNNIMAYDAYKILDNGFGKYKYKLIVKYRKVRPIDKSHAFEDTCTTFLVFFNTDNVSRKLFNAFLESGIDIYNLKKIHSKKESPFELLRCVYDDQILTSKYDALTNYIKDVFKNENPDVFSLLWSVRINIGEYQACKTTFSFKV